MIEDQCDHEWKRHTGVGPHREPATYICKKCNHEMAAGVVFQLEEMKKQSERHKEILEAQEKYNSQQLWWSRALVFATWALVVVTYLLTLHN